MKIAIILFILAGYMFYLTFTLNDVVILLTLKAGIGSLVAGCVCAGISQGDKK